MHPNPIIIEHGDNENIAFAVVYFGLSTKSEPLKRKSVLEIKSYAYNWPKK